MGVLLLPALHFRGMERHPGSFALHGSTLQRMHTSTWAMLASLHSPPCSLEGGPLGPTPMAAAPVTHTAVPAWEDSEALCRQPLFVFTKTLLCRIKWECPFPIPSIPCREVKNVPTHLGRAT